MIRVGFQGVKGAYSEMAALEFYEGEVCTIPQESFEEVFEGVVSGELDRGIIPIENSLAGSIRMNYDLLQKHSVWIEAEHKFRVSHNLLAVPGTSLESIEKVFSHSQALSQCAGYVRRLPRAQPMPYFDTAGSAEYISKKNDKTIAAIAGHHAAEEYGLKVLEEGIEDNSENYTRFLVIQKIGGSGQPEVSSGIRYKTSIVFALKNIPGCLYKCLSVFAIRDIDLFKIESRPIPGSPWQYVFYLDFDGEASTGAGAKALGHLDEITAFCKVLGSYPAAEHHI